MSKPKYIYKYNKWCTVDKSACVNNCNVDTSKKELSRCRKCGLTVFH